MVGEVVTVKAEDDENSGIRGNKTTTKKSNHLCDDKLVTNDF